MFDIKNSIFDVNKTVVPKDTEVIFVADLFVDDYVGGAELTSEALIKTSPYRVFKLKCSDVTEHLIHENKDKFWIFGNFVTINPQLIPQIIGLLKYSVLEYDYKYCQLRSPEKHLNTLKTPCDCHNQMSGKIISAFMHGAMHLWWMSKAQLDKYTQLFPFLSSNKNTVLSSVFDNQTLLEIKSLREKFPLHQKLDEWIVLDSPSWIKGTYQAESWCLFNKKTFLKIGNVPYKHVLEYMAKSKGFVYLPEGADTCPRMVIEAKLLGCELVLNDFVQHKDEEWFQKDNLDDIESHLLKAPDIFWSGIKQAIDYKPAISAYTTTYNAHSQGYPYVESIKSMLQFADEVCIVDGGSTDYNTLCDLLDLAYPPSRTLTFDEDMRCLIALAQAAKEESFTFPDEYHGVKRDDKIKVKIVFRDWSDTRSAVFDGAQKAEARKMCTKEFCWQFDIDEVVHEDDSPKIHELCRVMPHEIDIISLPVIEYWGGEDKVRADIQPWKWRLSRNKDTITHGIPAQFRRFDNDGKLYAAEGTDGCDMIDSVTHQHLGHISFYSLEVDTARQVACAGNEQALQQYETWYNDVTNSLPCVFHYSWFNLERKINLYKNFWTRHWNSLYNKSLSDTAENNMMFDMPWSSVTDDMIKELAAKLKTTGGHVWHTKWKGQITPWIKSTRSQPAIMKAK
jgi:hypothetical protein